MALHALLWSCMVLWSQVWPCSFVILWLYIAFSRGRSSKFIWSFCFEGSRLEIKTSRGKFILMAFVSFKYFIEVKFIAHLYIMKSDWRFLGNLKSYLQKFQNIHFWNICLKKRLELLQPSILKEASDLM